MSDAPWSKEQKRILDKITKTRDGCWEWQGALNKTGYGIIRFKNKTCLAHRVSYLVFTDTDPAQKFCCHKCDNRVCVNPDHIFLGTNSDNIQDAVAKGRHKNASLTHCRRGHEFTETNTSIQKTKRDGFERRCITCANDRSRKYNKKPERLAYQREYQRRLRSQAKLVGVKPIEKGKSDE